MRSNIVKAVVLILLLLNIIYNLVTKLIYLFRDFIKSKLIINKRIAKACKKFTQILLTTNKNIELFIFLLSAVSVLLWQNKFCFARFLFLVFLFATVVSTISQSTILLFSAINSVFFLNISVLSTI